MILLTTREYDEDGYIEFHEDETKTRYPEVKMNTSAYLTTENEVILENKGPSYIGAVIEFYSKDNLELDYYIKLRQFIERNPFFNVSLLTGTYEVYQAALNIENGQAKITANVSKII